MNTHRTAYWEACLWTLLLSIATLFICSTCIPTHQLLVQPFPIRPASFKIEVIRKSGVFLLHVLLAHLLSASKTSAGRHLTLSTHLWPPLKHPHVQGRPSRAWDCHLGLDRDSPINPEALGSLHQGPLVHLWRPRCQPWSGPNARDRPHLQDRRGRIQAKTSEVGDGNTSMCYLVI